MLTIFTFFEINCLLKEILRGILFLLLISLTYNFITLIITYYYINIVSLSIFKVKFLSF